MHELTFEGHHKGRIRRVASASTQPKFIASPSPEKVRQRSDCVGRIARRDATVVPWDFVKSVMWKSADSRRPRGHGPVRFPH